MQFALDTLDYTAIVEDKVIQLTPAEYRLLSVLLQSRNHIVRSSYLSIELFGDVDFSKLDILTKRIQKKTGIKIEKIKRIGYRLSDSV